MVPGAFVLASPHLPPRTERGVDMPYLTHEFIVIWGVQLFTRRHPNTNPKPGGLALHQLSVLHMAVWVVGILLLTAPLGWLTATFFSEPMNHRLRGARPPRRAEQSGAGGWVQGRGQSHAN